MACLRERITIALTGGQYGDSYYFRAFRDSWSWGVSSYLLLILLESWFARPFGIACHPVPASFAVGSDGVANLELCFPEIQPTKLAKCLAAF